MNRQILVGDVLDKLREIPKESIDVVITSPPYWGLRNYGVEGQWGLEKDFHNYLFRMKAMMDDIKRVLKDTGTVWVNLGDTYSNSGNGVEEKSQYGIPQRFYSNCIDAGWRARNFIPWIKENNMPSSVKDRFTNKWEPIMFFAKERKYYFNLSAVREESKTPKKPAKKHQYKNEKLFNGPITVENYRKELDIPGQSTHGIHRRREEGQTDWEGYEKKQDNYLKADGKPDPTKKGFNDRWKNRKHANLEYGQTIQTLTKKSSGGYDMVTGESLYHPDGKNPGDVLFLNVRPYTEAHFATFPVGLPLWILKCACPPDGIVLDPFFGAGTVGLAAEQLGMKWCGIELNEEYVRIARRRLDKYQNTKIDMFEE